MSFSSLHVFLLSYIITSLPRFVLTRWGLCIETPQVQVFRNSSSLLGRPRHCYSQCVRTCFQIPGRCPLTMSSSHGCRVKDISLEELLVLYWKVPAKKVRETPEMKAGSKTSHVWGKRDWENSLSSSRESTGVNNWLGGLWPANQQRGNAETHGAVYKLCRVLQVVAFLSPNPCWGKLFSFTTDVKPPMLMCVLMHIPDGNPHKNSLFHQVIPGLSWILFLK